MRGELQGSYNARLNWAVRPKHTCLLRGSLHQPLLLHERTQGHFGGSPHGVHALWQGRHRNNPRFQVFSGGQNLLSTLSRLIRVVLDTLRHICSPSTPTTAHLLLRRQGAAHEAAHIGSFPDSAISHALQQQLLQVLGGRRRERSSADTATVECAGAGSATAGATTGSGDGGCRRRDMQQARQRGQQ